MPTRATVIRTTTMTGDDAVTGARRDVAVIMCRGASRRFGAPKALACVGNDPRPLLRRVADCFTGRFAGGIIVITTGDLAASCRSTLEGVPDVIVVPGPAGGDTALTLALAWEHLAALVPPCTHVWAHPVDVPDIAAQTFVQLAAVSESRPERAVRPTWSGTPGHPLVLPVAMLGLLAPEARSWRGPWREVMERAVADGRIAAPLLVAVADPGVVHDHDEPDAMGGGTAAGGRNDDT
ncbi:MAG: NTP transferase domain-containing protein [bacterium]|nr:NTP transferase domain-containing protein [bacterium]